MWATAGPHQAVRLYDAGPSPGSVGAASWCIAGVGCPGVQAGSSGPRPALGRVQVCPLLGWGVGVARAGRVALGIEGDRGPGAGVSRLSCDREVSVERLEVADGGGSPVRLQCSAQHADAFLST